MQVSRAWRSAARSPTLWREIRWPAHLPLTPDLLTRTLALSSAGRVRVLDLSIPMEAWCDDPELCDALGVDTALVELRGCLSGDAVAGEFKSNR